MYAGGGGGGGPPPPPSPTSACSDVPAADVMRRGRRSITSAAGTSVHAAGLWASAAASRQSELHSSSGGGIACLLDGFYGANPKTFVLRQHRLRLQVWRKHWQWVCWCIHCWHAPSPPPITLFAERSVCHSPPDNPRVIRQRTDHME